MPRIKALNKIGARPTNIDADDADWQRNEQAYRDGELARRKRKLFESCPFGTTDPMRVDWERGWYSRRVAESDAEELLPSLLRARLTTSLPDLEELDTDRRFELLDWLDTFPRNGLSKQRRAAFDLRRPTWVHINSPVIPTDDQLRVITFGQQTRPAQGTLPPLREIPPANDEESLLQDHLRRFDDMGVSLIEEQWQEMTEPDQQLALHWLEGRLKGVMSPLPPCLFQYATQELKANADFGEVGLL